MIKFKQFNVGDSGYEEQMEKFQIEHPQAEFLQITGGHMSHEQIWFKYDDGAEQTKLSIPRRIAEELEEYDIGEKGNYSLFGLSAEAREFYLTHNNIVTIYFASKALGVELVEVTDE
ncbi:hypothetical protein ET006_05345 [Lactococcus garvieae]|nr:hypothetical protein [Lactococcus garvieae]UKS67707.1 hypothetical protein G8766_04225 [Lactococcus garvieae]